MARPVMLGNGSLTVGLNEHGLVHDFYYPYVGLENLTTSRSVHHKIGIQVDNNFTWVDDGSWDINVNFYSDALISNISMKHAKLGIELLFNDFVDQTFDAFCRKITIVNNNDRLQEVRLFMHQVFEISSAGRGDTALYVPEANYIFDYKGRCSLLIYGEDADNSEGFDQYAVGNYGIEGKEGTFRDAEDGDLSNSSVEHGGVDSVIRFTKSIEANSLAHIDYWIVASDSQYNAEKIHESIKTNGLTNHLERTREYWHEWLNIGNPKLSLIPKEYLVMIKKSLMIIKAHTDKRGGIIASCDSSIYNYGRDYYSYVWPRDGAYAMWPLIRMGYTEESKKFFEFCRDILAPGGYLMHKYQPDRAIGSTWHPLLHGKRKELAIQEDETASVIYMLGEYYRQTNDREFVQSLYSSFIQPAANFLASFIDSQTQLPHASYDLWEEKFLTSTYTTSITYQALLVATDFADDFNFSDDSAHWKSVASQILENSKALFNSETKTYRKGFLLNTEGSLDFDNTLDVSSLYGVMMYGLHDSDLESIHSTAQAIESTLLDQSPSGGSPRYENDNYFKSDPPYMGNPWSVTTLWMAQYYSRINQHEKTRKYIDWVISLALPSGSISEQVNPTTGVVVSVTPLVWSHAELINTVLDLVE